MDAYKFILESHSGVAYVAILTLGIAVINSFIGISAKNEFKPKDKRIAMFALIASHIQLVLGMALYFVSPKGFSLFGELGMKGIMGNSEIRLLAVEHPLINIIAIILITIGWSKHKKSLESSAKFKKIAIFYLLGMILLLSRIPWSQWFA